MSNELHFGDNLDVLEAMPARSIDLIYLDPPFNSNATYNVLYGTRRGGPSQAQSHTFSDTWEWGTAARRAIERTAQRDLKAGALLDAFAAVFPESTMLAYLAMMAVRLIEMRRVLKDTGTIYLHCDPTASHYLKILMDAIFGTRCYLNEIIWKRTSAHSSAKRYGPVHDTLLFYSKTDTFTWSDIRLDYDDEYLNRYYKYDDGDGRLYWRNSLTAAGLRNGSSGSAWRGFDPRSQGAHWKFTVENLERLDAEGKIYWPPRGRGWPQIKRYRDELKGVAISDLWDDIDKINPAGHERLGYSTQKPLELLKRIIMASSKEGDVILDPFCGCGTEIEAAQQLNRQWIGIDVTYLAIHVIEKRLVDAFKEGIKDKYRLFGRPMDPHDAIALAGRDWLEFQKWVVLVLGGLPKEKPGPDGGIDGIIRYHRVGVEQPNRAVVSVKGGRHVGVDSIHKLKSVVIREKAELGILVCIEPPTGAMINEADSEGDVGPASRRVRKLQIVTVDMLFQPQPIELPGTLDPPEIGRPTLPMPRQLTRRRGVEGQGELLLPLTKDKKYPAPPRVRGRAIRDVQIEVTRPTFGRRKK